MAAYGCESWGRFVSYVLGDNACSQRTRKESIKKHTASSVMAEGGEVRQAGAGGHAVMGIVAWVRTQGARRRRVAAWVEYVLSVSGEQRALAVLVGMFLLCPGGAVMCHEGIAEGV
jgi:hypothetical protein